MISAILIENFKRFGPMGEGDRWLPLRPITILLGPNSSGKSSVIHALLMFAQTCRRGVTGILELQTTGSLIDLGTFSNAYHGATCRILGDTCPLVWVPSSRTTSTRRKTTLPPSLSNPIDSSSSLLRRCRKMIAEVPTT